MKEIEEINDNLETKEEVVVLKSTRSTKEVIEAAYLEALKSQNVVQHSLEDVAKSTYLDYSMSVIVGRAIPDVRDGLKPVHRRILYAMNNDLNITAKSSYVKSAKVVGTCLVGGTLVSTPKGLVKIENINVGDKVFTQTGIENVSKLFYQPKQKILNISLNGNIYSNQSTFDHKFKTLNENCEYEFVEASKLKENDYLILKPSLIDLEESIYNNEETYVLGMLLADGNLDRNKQKNINYLSFTNNDLNILNKINNYFGGSFNIRKSNTTYRLKISNKELTHNFIKKFDLINKYSYTIHNINDYLNKFSNENLFSFVSGFIDGDGFIRKDRNEITISSVDDKFLSYLSKLIFDRTGIYSYMTENITSKDGKIYQDRIIKANYNIYNIIFSGKNAYDLSLKLNLFSTKKKNRLLNISQSKITLSNIIPFYGKKIFELFKEKHLGGGWYLDTNNKKFRDGIKYQNGAKIRYPKDLNNTINLYSDNIDKLNILKKLQKLDIKLYNELKEIINSKILFIPISKIEEVEEQFTYDFTVDNKHEFIANGMMSSNCLGSYHPHGDTSVYDAMVGMSQDFNYREPLLDGQGNWGNIDGDSAAAMRYTEVRLSPHGYSLLNNIEKKSVKFRPNFDDSTEEPDVLPAMLPNILINGTEGIAVGMATNMASHNANEIIEATIASIKNPDISIDELRKYIKGPDMPTGGIIMKDSMDNIYTHGIGRFYVKAKYHVEDEGRKIVITEIPFQVNKPNIVVQIAELVRNKQVGGIVGAQDESNKEGLRLVISIKRGENVKIIMNTLFKKTDLQRSYSIKNLVINEEKEPVILNLKEILTTFINFRKQVVTKDFEFDINKLEKRAHLLRGIVIALNNLDRTLEIIRASNNSIESKDNLIKEFNIDEAQAQAIIDTKLQKLSNMETTSIFNELNEIEVEINKLSTIISTDKELSTYIINELKDLNKKFKSPRKSLITDEEPFISNEALITDEDVAIIITKDGFIRKTPLDNFKAQHRGGKGKTIITLRDGDYVKNVLFCKNNEHLTIFTKNNKAFILPVYTVTESSKGRLVTNLIEDDSGVFDIIHTTDSKEMLFVTEKGQMIKLSGKHFIKIRANGIKAIQLNDNDKLIKVLPINETDTHLMAITKDGITMTTSVKSFRTLGRGASGVKGISIRKGDMVVDACIVNEENKVLLISEKGYGKQNLVSDFRVTNRGSKGVKSFKISDKTGNVVGIIKSKEDQDLVVTTKKGIIIRTPLNKVSTNNGRVTVGVKIIDLKDDDEVISFDAYEQMEIFED